MLVGMLPRALSNFSPISPTVSATVEASVPVSEGRISAASSLAFATSDSSFSSTPLLCGASARGAGTSGFVEEAGRGGCDTGIDEPMLLPNTSPAQARSWLKQAHTERCKRLTLPARAIITDGMSKGSKSRTTILTTMTKASISAIERAGAFLNEVCTWLSAEFIVLPRLLPASSAKPLKRVQATFATTTNRSYSLCVGQSIFPRRSSP